MPLMCEVIYTGQHTFTASLPCASRQILHRMLIVAMGTASLLPSLLMTSLAKKTLAHGGYRPDSHTIACLLTESHAAGRGAGVVRTCGWPLQG